MAIWHGYLAVEDLALEPAQRQAVIAAFRTLGPDSDPSPARLNHRRVSLDGSKAIFEAAFNEDNLTIANVKQFLANAAGVNVENIDHTLTQTARGPLVVFSAGGVDRMRFLAFGGIGATWQESRDECAAYLDANRAEWEANEA